jgi:hypothetical protein
MKTLLLAVSILLTASFANAQCNVFAYSQPAYQQQTVVYQQPAYEPVCNQQYQAVALQPAYAAVPEVRNFVFQQGLPVPVAVPQPQYAYSYASITALQPTVGVQSYYPSAISSNAVYSSNIYAAANGFQFQGNRNYHHNNNNGIQFQVRGFNNNNNNRNNNFNGPANVNLNNLQRGTNVTVNPPGLFNRTTVRVR